MVKSLGSVGGSVVVEKGIAAVLEDDAVGNLDVQPGFWEAMEALGEDRYYPAIDMEGVTP